MIANQHIVLTQMEIIDRCAENLSHLSEGYKQIYIDEVTSCELNCNR